MSLCAAAVLTLGACRAGSVEPRQPERVVRLVPSKLPRTPAPTPLKVEVLTPRPSRPPQTSVAASGNSVSAMKAYIRKVFGREGDRAVAVANCETGGTWNPKARGALGEQGLFQLRPEYHAWRAKAVGGTSLYDWRTNVRAAFHLFSEQGWRPWSCAGVRW